MGAGLPLFRRFAGLAERLPRHPLLSGPTPVLPCALPGVADLWVKHDERSTPRYGGNKPRKLEFLIGDALARRSRRLVTSGGLGTNHGLATALLARDAGLATTLLLVDQPVTDAVRHQLLLLHAAGARLRYGGGVLGAAREGALELARATLAGERPRVVPTGGSSACGNLGFVSAGLELAEQIEAGVMPRPAEIHVAVGSGGTIAGLVVGLALAGLEIPVVGALVTDILPPSPESLTRTANSILALLHRLAPEIPRPQIETRHFRLDASQLGAGYGAETAACRDAIEAAAACGLSLDTTYSSKCLATLIARVQRSEAPHGPLLFWNTHNSVVPEPPNEASSATAEISPRIRALIEGES